MVVTCIVPNCGDSSREWRMLRFPKQSEKEVYEIWLQRIEGPNFKGQVLSSIHKRNVVCEKHFSDFCRVEDSAGNLSNLKRGSLPTIDVPGFSDEPTLDNSLYNKKMKKVTKPRAAKHDNLDYSDEMLEFMEQCMLCMTREESEKYYKVTSKMKKSETFIALLQGIVGSEIDTGNIHTICSKCRDIVNEFYTAKKRCDEIQQILIDYLNKDGQPELEDKLDDKVQVFKSESDDKDYVENYDNSDDTSFMLEVKLLVAKAESSDDETDEFADFDDPPEKPRKYVTKKGKKRKPADTKTQCDVCQKNFTRNSSLKAHMLTHGANKPFVCEICGKIYKHNTALKIHLGMHNGINPFTCEYCKKSFTQKIALLRHIPIHTGETPHVCDLCGKRFIHRTSFRIHKLNHAGEKNFKCPICNFAFLSRSHLNRHLKRHTGEKNFACHVCGRRFAERYNLMCHQKMHASQELEKPPELSEVFKYEVLSSSKMEAR